MALIDAYRASGMTMAAFARRERINYTTFAGWMNRAGAMAPSSAIRFAEVKMPMMAASTAKGGAELEVRLADGTVVRGARVADVIVLVRALRS
jgi:hypothetical protein